MNILERLIAPLAPFCCIVCYQEGSLLCNWCKPDALMVVPSRCCYCFTATKEHATCKACRRKQVPRNVWVATEYEGAAKELIYRQKFARAQSAATVMADLLDETLPYLLPSTLVTHIPTATSRVRMRGYDHAQLLAKAIATKRSLTYAPLLARMGHSRQVGAKRDQRKTQLQTAFRSLNAPLAQKATILLIDDVITTGATIEAATGVLRTAGAKQVYAALFAQKH